MTLEVYNQKQNTLFISECVEHRRFKVTWARLWVYLDGCTDKCTIECTFRAYARPDGSADRDNGLERRAAPLFVAHDRDECAARLIMVHGLVGRVHGSVATHGLVAHGLNFMGMIEPCG